MKVFFAVLAAILYAVSGLHAGGPPTPYTAVEIDKFVAAHDVAFPADSQSALVEDIAREVSLAFQTVIVVRQGEAVPYGHQVLRISGTVTKFKPGNRAKRQLIGLGAGATVVEAQVMLTDVATGQVLLSRDAKGVTWTGIAGGDSKSAVDSLARKIAKFCNSNHLVESN
ncbi:MAG: DUF4410 domain-containing protein [Bryobacteraceae bacterium]|jgi:hypothetical protein